MYVSMHYSFYRTIYSKNICLLVCVPLHLIQPLLSVGVCSSIHLIQPLLSVGVCSTIHLIQPLLSVGVCSTIHLIQPLLSVGVCSTTLDPALIVCWCVFHYTCLCSRLSTLVLCFFTHCADCFLYCFYFICPDDRFSTICNEKF